MTVAQESQASRASKELRAAGQRHMGLCGLDPNAVFE